MTCVTWNRYPGARTDSDSWVYGYSFSKELQDKWDWTERFPTQPETLSYLSHVADRFDIRKDIEFSTRVTAAHYDEDSNTWAVTTNHGQTYTCTYFIPSCGPLSVPYRPDFPGIDDYTGDWYLTGHWPKEGVEITGKKVICIGTGATAVQLIPIVAKTAAELTVFQRTPKGPRRRSPTCPW
ncbi:MAG TPA: NAD(P)/FAD-dependent oxidoreductase [Pseudonocardia sp.]